MKNFLFLCNESNGRLFFIFFSKYPENNTFLMKSILVFFLKTSLIV